jgi:hypothetical protein
MYGVCVYVYVYVRERKKLVCEREKKSCVVYVCLFERLERLGNKRNEKKKKPVARNWWRQWRAREMKRGGGGHSRFTPARVSFRFFLDVA